MRIATLLPVADRPASRAYALWGAAARDLSAALSSRGFDVTSVSVQDPRAGSPIFRHGLGTVDDSLRVAQLYRRANDFDLVHDMLGYPALSYASFVATPVLSTVWMEMWQAASAVYHDLNQRVFYFAPGDRDRSTGLLYSATIPWALDPASISPAAAHDDSLVFAGDVDADGDVLSALELASRVERPLVLVGGVPESPFFREQLLPRIDGQRVLWIEDAASPEAHQAVRRASALVHAGSCDGMQQLVLLDAALGGTPVIAIGEIDRPCWLRDGLTGVMCRTVDEAVGAVGRVHEWNHAACRDTVAAERPFDAFVEAVTGLYARIVEQQKREDHRPWGYYQVLADEPDHKVKRIVVYPGKRLSLQRHARRYEHWYLLDGEAAVVIDEEEIRVLRGQSIEIPKGCWHRIRNPGSQNLTLIEVQTGDYFGEDDIERKEDDFGRS